MSSGMKWLFALAMFVAVPAGCFTDAPVPQDEANAPAVSVEEQPLEGTLRCPGGLVDCCGDGTCILPQVCKHTQCASDEAGPKALAACPDGWADCCDDGACFHEEVCRWMQCASDEPGPKALGY